MTYSPWYAIQVGERDRKEQRAKMEFALSRAQADLLDEPWVQPILARVGAAVDPDYPGRVEHAKRVTLDVVSALTRPRHPVNQKFNRYASGASGGSFGGIAAASPKEV